MTRFKCVQANVIVHPKPFVIHDFTIASKIMSMEQFLAAAVEQGVLAQDEIEVWQRELRAADAGGVVYICGDDVCGGRKEVKIP